MSEKADSTNASLDSTDTGSKPEMPAESLEAPSDLPTDSCFQILPPFKDETKSKPVHTVAQQTSTLPANLLTTATSVAWIALLIYHGAAGSSLPWCITLAAIAVWALATTRSQIQKHALTASRIGMPEEGRLAKAFSTTYLTVSLLMFTWFCLHGFKIPPPLVAQKQFIDIELTSFADFKDNKELVASTEERTARENAAAALTNYR